MSLDRVASSVSFNTGISMAEYNEAPAGQTAGTTQRAILPGSTTVSEALASVFPRDPTVAGQITGLLAEAGASTLLRTAGGFHAAARRTIDNLRRKGGKDGKGGGAAARAAAELEGLLADTELLDFYRASLLET